MTENPTPRPLVGRIREWLESPTEGGRSAAHHEWEMREACDLLNEAAEALASEPPVELEELRAANRLLRGALSSVRAAGGVTGTRGFTATEDGDLLCNACTGYAGHHDSDCRYAVREVAGAEQPRTVGLMRGHLSPVVGGGRLLCGCGAGVFYRISEVALRCTSCNKEHSDPDAAPEGSPAPEPLDCGCVKREGWNVALCARHEQQAREEGLLPAPEPRTQERETLAGILNEYAEASHAWQDGGFKSDPPDSDEYVGRILAALRTPAAGDEWL